MSASDSVQVSLEVRVDPDTAFRVFTEDVNSWWKQGARYRFVAPYRGAMKFLPGVGGKLVHVHAESKEEFVVGEVSVWEPGSRLVFGWRLPNFEPSQLTEVEVTFESCSVGTRITVIHRGWDQLAADHPARHGLTGHPFVMSKGQWWADQITALKRVSESKGPTT